MLDNKIELKRFIFECIEEYLEARKYESRSVCRICNFHNGDNEIKWVNNDYLCQRCQESL